jgi:hypothetical protein
MTSITLSQFYGTQQLLKIDLASGTRQIIPAAAGCDTAFGMFEAEDSQHFLALLAKPDGPLLIFQDGQHGPQLGKTSIAIIDEGDYSHCRILHEGALVMELAYQCKHGIGLNPYNRTREDIDFYYWLSKNIGNPALYATYTRTP